MTQFSTDILSIIDQAVVLARGGRIYYANSSAAAILGGACVGEKISRFFSSEIVGAQSADFTADAVFDGKSYLVRVTRRENIQVFALNEVKLDSDLINDAFLCSLRSTAMMLSMSSRMCMAKLDENVSPELSSAIASVNKSISITSRLIANISTAKDIISGSLNFVPKYIDLSMLCRDCAEAVREFLPGLEISLNLPSEAIAAADPTLMEILVMNLLSNSIRHGRCSSISIRLSDCGESYILAVSDNGVGIKPEDMGSVFERYSHSFELSNMNGGAGFGLTVVRGIAEKHGGTLLLESRKELGTAVRVSIRKNLRSVPLHSAEPYCVNSNNLLIQLSDCLPESFFSEKYLD